MCKGGGQEARTQRLGSTGQEIINLIGALYAREDAGFARAASALALDRPYPRRPSDRHLAVRDDRSSVLPAARSCQRAPRGKERRACGTDRATARRSMPVYPARGPCVVPPRAFQRAGRGGHGGDAGVGRAAVRGAARGVIVPPRVRTWCRRARVCRAWCSSARPPHRASGRRRQVSLLIMRIGQQLVAV